MRLTHLTYALRLCPILLAGIPATGAVVTLQPPQAVQGLYAIPIRVAPASAEQMASLQFNVSFNAANTSVVSIEAGAIASAALKDVIFSTISPGNIKVVVAGLNQDILQEGIVATMYMQSATTETTPAIEVSSLVGADPIGNSVDISLDNQYSTTSNTNDSQESEAEEADYATDAETASDEGGAVTEHTDQQLSPDKSLKDFGVNGGENTNMNLSTQVPGVAPGAREIQNSAAANRLPDAAARPGTDPGNEKGNPVYVMDAPVSTTINVAPNNTPERRQAPTKVSSNDSTHIPGTMETVTDGVPNNMVPLRTSREQTAMLVMPRVIGAPGMLHENIMLEETTQNVSYTKWLPCLLPLLFVAVVFAAHQAFLCRPKKKQHTGNKGHHWQ